MEFGDEAIHWGWGVPMHDLSELFKTPQTVAIEESVVLKQSLMFNLESALLSPPLTL